MPVGPPSLGQHDNTDDTDDERTTNGLQLTPHGAESNPLGEVGPASHITHIHIHNLSTVFGGMFARRAPGALLIY